MERELSSKPARPLLLYSRRLDRSLQDVAGGPEEALGGGSGRNGRPDDRGGVYRSGSAARARRGPCKPGEVGGGGAVRGCGYGALGAVVRDDAASPGSELEHQVRARTDGVGGASSRAVLELVRIFSAVGVSRGGPARDI